MDAARINLSAAALRQRELTVFFLVVIALAGAGAYFKLGQSEDPDFAFRAMVVRSFWPGATAEQVDRQLTDRIEKKLQDTPYFKLTRSYSKPGESLIIVELADSSPAKEVAGIWYQVRRNIGDIRASLPPETIGPFFNDEFGDVYGSIYAFTADGYSHSELRDHVERVRQALLRLPNVAKAELVGVQEDRIYVELSGKRLAALGISAATIAQALAAQNAVLSPGTVETGNHRVALRVTGQLDSEAAVAGLLLHAGGRTLRLGDLAEVHRGSADPPTATMRLRGREAIGLAVSMVKNGDVIRLGRDLKDAMARVRADLPVGIEFEQISDQPAVVKRAIGEFMGALGEAVAIVLAVSFLSLGLRTGLVVALTIPLVLLATFLAMYALGIDLHRISTGALIIALGLLVDDAMIAVEMMARKLEEGFDRLSAATAAYRSTAFPMLSGTLITAAGFLPIATAKSSTGEYTYAIFAVTTAALVLSWFAAVIATPFLGAWLLKERRVAAGESPRDVYASRFYRRLRALIEWCIVRRKTVLAATAASFALGVVGMGLTEKQFFPPSDRGELMVELWLPENASLAATEREAAKVEALLAQDAGIATDVTTFVSYVGSGSPRFFLSLDQQLYRTNFAQVVALTRDVAARERVAERLRTALEADFPGVRTRVVRVPLGPPVVYPVQFRVTGDDPQRLKAVAERVAERVRAHPHTREVNLDWGERVLAMKIAVDQEQARALGASSAAVSRAVAGAVNGTAIGQYRENDRLIDVVLRAPQAERRALAALGELPVPTANGQSVPLAQLARVSETFEEPILWRRSRELTLMVRADVADGAQGPDVTMAIAPALAELRGTLPPGMRIEAAGAYEESAAAQASIMAGMPLMAAVVLGLLMLQLKSFSRSLMVVLTAPLGIVGVAAALLVFGRPFGFVAMLGTIALGGMIMRNTVILVDQIEQDIAAGSEPWSAIREATVRRFRPITLTAAAAVLAMIPLTRSVLWGPMAIAIMGGLIVATVLTVVFVPALYAAWFGVRLQAVPRRARPPRDLVFAASDGR
ncbi:MAG: efflux RND transporter permease subunit [Betaproteobacteria bacterium]|nr:efflux RND transporter permease subunit [Betaproteobacteria bacterium]